MAKTKPSTDRQTSTSVVALDESETGGAHIHTKARARTHTSKHHPPCDNANAIYPGENPI